MNERASQSLSAPLHVCFGQCHAVEQCSTVLQGVTTKSPLRALINRVTQSLRGNQIFSTITYLCTTQYFVRILGTIMRCASVRIAGIVLDPRLTPRTGVHL